MPRVSKQELLKAEIGGRSLLEWDTLWKPLQTAFTKPHPELRSQVGLIRVKLNGAIKYIIRATEPVGGIAKGLTRIRGPEQTGNSGYGAQMIRKHINKVEVDVLIVGESLPASQVTKALKQAMNTLHDPPWNWPFKRRMKAIQAGKIPPD